MRTRLKRAWRRFADAPPGTRFERLHQEHQKGRHLQWMRPLMILLGIVVIAVGVVLLPAPGPGWLVIGAGAGLLARELLFLARFLDRLEVRVRRIAGRLRRRLRAG